MKVVDVAGLEWEMKNNVYPTWLREAIDHHSFEVRSPAEVERAIKQLQELDKSIDSDYHRKHIALCLWFLGEPQRVFRFRSEEPEKGKEDKEK